MDKQQRKIQEFFSVKRVAIPVFIGIAVTVLLFLKDFNLDDISNFNWEDTSLGYLCLSFLMVLAREAALMARLKVVAGKTLSWKQCFQIIILWSFASAASPTIIGGGAIALFVLNKEGLKLGRATAIVLVCTVLDEISYLFLVPIVISMTGTENLLVSSPGYLFLDFKWGVIGLFTIANSLILIYVILVVYGVFVNPRGIKMGLLRLFRLSFLRRWQDKAEEVGNDIIITSKEFRKKSLLFWLKVFGASIGMWLARFGIVNFLILAFVGYGDQLLIFARQVVIWALLLVSPTPGGSGIAEYAFAGFLGEFIPDQTLVPALSVTWRLFSYYPFLILGLFVLPAWLQRVYKPTNKEQLTMDNG
jgi:uncharacterized protein (TIRG00374 family)